MNGPEIGAVIFDFGGVLTSPVRKSIDAWLEADGIERESFSRTLKSWLSRQAAEGTPVHQLETGELPATEFEVVLANELTTLHGRPVQPAGLLSRLFARMLPDPEMFALVEDLRAAGIKVALLSNSWGNTYPRERIDALFDQVVISGEVGLRKPHAAIYRLTLERLGVPAARAVFLDDAEPNVDGARAVGLPAVHHQNPASTRTVLAELVPALSVPIGVDS